LRPFSNFERNDFWYAMPTITNLVGNAFLPPYLSANGGQTILTVGGLPTLL
jgi:hypothetical protein